MQFDQTIFDLIIWCIYPSSILVLFSAKLLLILRHFFHPLNQFICPSFCDFHFCLILASSSVVGIFIIRELYCRNSSRIRNIWCNAQEAQQSATTWTERILCVYLPVCETNICINRLWIPFDLVLLCFIFVWSNSVLRQQLKCQSYQNPSLL